MGTPRSILEELVPKRQITEADWHKFIELRRQMIKPHLHYFTLEKLGEVRCMGGGGGYHSLQWDKPQVTRECAQNLETQGVFFWTSKPVIGDDQKVSLSKGNIVLYGLTRSGEWAIAQVYLTINHEVGGAEYYQKADSVVISAVDVPTLLATARIDPRTLFDQLGEAVEEWCRDRKRLLDQAKKIRLASHVDSLLVLSLIVRQ